MRIRYNGVFGYLQSDMAANSATMVLAAPLTYGGSAAVAVPSPSGTDYFLVSLIDPITKRLAEIVSVTAIASDGVTCTVVRGREGTTAGLRVAGSPLGHSAVASDIPGVGQNVGDTLQWDGTKWVPVSNQQRNVQTRTAAAYTLAASDASAFLLMSSTSAQTLTIPASATTSFLVGTLVEGVQLGAGQVTVVAASGVTLTAAPGPKTASQGSTFGVLCVATDAWVAYGRLSS